MVHTSDGASQFNDCVHSSSEESFIPSPQDSVPSVHEVRGSKAVKALEVESEARDVLRALPPDSEMRFASMVAAAQQAAAAALSAASPRRNVGGVHHESFEPLAMHGVCSNRLEHTFTMIHPTSSISLDA